MSNNVLTSYIEVRREEAVGLPYSHSMTMKELEKTHIINALVKLDGNKTKVANVLGFTLKTLYNKLKAYELDGFIKKRGSNVR